jgi:ABC-2 type transport system ATP-binding protein
MTTWLTPTSGNQTDGLDPVTQQHEARRRFGIVFQDPELTAYEYKHRLFFENTALTGSP